MENIHTLLQNTNVEWKTLGEVAEILDSKRKPISKAHRTSGQYPYYGANGIQDYINDYIFDGTFLLIGEDGSVINEDGSPVLNWATGKIWVNNHAHILAEKSEIVLLRFVYFFLATIDVRNVVKGNIPKITQQDLRNFLIPIPPLSVQKEIVRILDTFTELTTELTAELTARKKQYEYYREQLLGVSGQGLGVSGQGAVEWKTLGELFEFKNGINKEKEFFGKGDKIINYTDVFKKRKIFDDDILGKVEINTSDIERFNCKIGDVFFTRTSETKDEIGYSSVLLSDIPICVFSGFLIRARPLTNLLLPEYCAYCFTSDEIRKKIISSSNMTTRVTTTGTILSKIKIPIPSLSEQERIVAILDKFDTLTSSISEGLPKEIELRQKQYEYYRSKLLSF